METGKLQKKWIESLRAHPERQCTGELGTGNPREYKACCLGELHLVAHRMKKKRLPFGKYGQLADGENDRGVTESDTLANSYEEYGLHDEFGKLKEPVHAPAKDGDDDDERFDSLAEMNDEGWSWLEIADYIQENPENIFTKTV